MKEYATCISVCSEGEGAQEAEGGSATKERLSREAKEAQKPFAFRRSAPGPASETCSELPLVAVGQHFSGAAAASIPNSSQK